jgi:hypothetical protein
VKQEAKNRRAPGKLRTSEKVLRVILEAPWALKGKA